MTHLTIGLQRLYHQRISGSDFGTVVETVKWLGALQAQDYASAEWTIGLRLPGAMPAAIAQAIAERVIVRTWLLRGTLHALGAAASMLQAAGVAALLGGGALAAFGWIGMTILVLSLPAAERAYSVRGQSRMLVDFAELLAERVAQRAH